jgi:hypothetical protein
MTRQEIIEKLAREMSVDYQAWDDVTAEQIIELLDRAGLVVKDDAPDTEA